MTASKGFSLIEIIVVLVIIGLAAAMTLPNLMSSSEVSKAHVAQSNLYAIAAAQSKFYEDYTSYCINVGNPVVLAGYPANCGDSAADLNADLHLSLTGPYAYSCADPTPTLLPYTCTATNAGDTAAAALTLTVTTLGGAVITCTGGPASSCPL